jgi:hypothetical protein
MEVKRRPFALFPGLEVEIFIPADEVQSLGVHGS